MYRYINIKKAVPICGMSILNIPEDQHINCRIKKSINNKEDYFYVSIYTKNQFKKIKDDNIINFFNDFEGDEYNLVLLYNTLQNNSEEIYYIKVILASLYFAKRLSSECIQFESSAIFYNIIENFYKNKSNQYTQLRAPIKIGIKAADKDSYNESISRLYGIHLEGEYAGHIRYLDNFNIRNSHLFIDYNDSFDYEYNKILNKLNDSSNYSKRMISAFRLYFDTIPEYDLEKNILSYGTIFETLLLENDESNQRKKVSVRSACLLCDELDLAEKEYIAEVIYQFYSYRNKIVHDGYCYLDLGNEVLVSKMLNCIKHIIYFLIKNIINKDIKNIDEIKDIVEKNKNDDSLDNAFDYVKDNINIDDTTHRFVCGDHHRFKKPNTEEERQKEISSLL